MSQFEGGEAGGGSGAVSFSFGQNSPVTRSESSVSLSSVISAPSRHYYGSFSFSSLSSVSSTSFASKESSDRPIAGTNISSAVEKKSLVAKNHYDSAPVLKHVSLNAVPTEAVKQVVSERFVTPKLAISDLAKDSQQKVQDILAGLKAPEKLENTIVRVSNTQNTLTPDLASQLSLLKPPTGEALQTIAKPEIANNKQAETIKEAARLDNQPQIKVVFTNTDNTANNADFVIGKDGKIQATNNETQTGKKELVILVERDPGQLKPSDIQQASINKLVSDLANKIKQDNPQLASTQIKIEDQQGLVSTDIKNAINSISQNTPPNQHFPETTQRQMEDMSRFRGAGSGSMSREEADSYFPERTVPRGATESERLAALKDVVAGFASKGQSKPYDYVQPRGERGFAVGRYGFTAGQIGNWLESLDLDNIEELERQGKVPPGTASRLRKMKAAYLANKNDPKSPQDPFLEKLAKGDPNNSVTAQDIAQNFGKEIQEIAANDMVRKYAWQSLNPDGSFDVGKVALSMQLGRQVTPEDLAKAENQSFIQAARQSYQLAEQRYTNGTGPINWTDASKKLFETAQANEGNALWRDMMSNPRLGCAAAMSKCLELTGFRGIKSAGVYDLVNKLHTHGFQEVSPNERMPGDIIYIKNARGHSHIGVVGENVNTAYSNSSSSGQWRLASIGSVFGGRGQITYLRAPGTNKAEAPTV